MVRCIDPRRHRFYSQMLGQLTGVSVTSPLTGLVRTGWSVLSPGSALLCRTWLKGMAIPEKSLSPWLRNCSCSPRLGFFFYFSLGNLSCPKTKEIEDKDIEFLPREIPYRITSFLFFLFSYILTTVANSNYCYNTQSNFYYNRKESPS